MKPWHEIQVGEAGELLRDGPLTVTDFVRYQGASGDMNPIHHDPAFAAAAGFSTPFAVGMRQAGILGTLIAEIWGRESVREFDIRFKAQAWPGDILTYSSRVTGKREIDGEKLVDLELAVHRQDGSVHITGTATVAIE